MSHLQTMAAVTAMAAALAIQPVLARVDVKVEFKKDFDFKAAKTWGWNPRGPGEIMMARTAEDDPDAMRARAEPIIVDAVSTGIGARGLQHTTAEPDLQVTYYLLLSTSTSTQTMGQFLPGATAWGVPPFQQATQAFEVMNRGSLVLDLSAKGTVVWRGVAQANIKTDIKDEKRESLIREAVRDLLKKYPPKN